MTASSPYSDLPDRAFWGRAVAPRAPLDPGDLFRPTFPISRDMTFVTAGSCFAQHVGRALKDSGFNVFDAEPVPAFITPAIAQSFGYGLYSARYGNIYTTRQLMQMVDEMDGTFAPADPVWEKDGRFYDAMRPNIEPDGLDSPDLVLAHRAAHLAQVKQAFAKPDVFVFTFGLTEAWIHQPTGTVYPTAPGTIAGQYDPAIHAFKNYSFTEVRDDFIAFRTRMMRDNPNLKFIITTSPVPLTATASGQHVEVATSLSKSILRAVCGELSATFDNIDYFPSYEIITSLNTRGVYFESNKRSVSRIGVQTAMRTFLASYGIAGSSAGPATPDGTDGPPQEVCEEALLEAFAK